MESLWCKFQFSACFVGDWNDLELWDVIRVLFECQDSTIHVRHMFDKSKYLPMCIKKIFLGKRK